MAVANKALLLYMTEIIDSTEITNNIGETTSLILTVEVGFVPYTKETKNVLFVINGFTITRHDTYEEAVDEYNKVVMFYSKFNNSKELDDLYNECALNSLENQVEQ